MRLLAGGRPPEDVVQTVARTLTNKLMHLPSSELRKAGERGDEEVLRAARSLFGIEDD